MLLYMILFSCTNCGNHMVNVDSKVNSLPHVQFVLITRTYHSDCNHYHAKSTKKIELEE